MHMELFMVCSKCKSNGIENSALGKVFYYCRTCRDEIRAEPVAIQPGTPVSTKTLVSNGIKWTFVPGASITGSNLPPPVTTTKKNFQIGDNVKVTAIGLLGVIKGPAGCPCCDFEVIFGGTVDSAAPYRTDELEYIT